MQVLSHYLALFLWELRGAEGVCFVDAVVILALGFDRAQVTVYSSNNYFADYGLEVYDSNVS